MADGEDSERTNHGFELDIRGGDKLVARFVPGRQKPYIGIERGNTFIALASFISENEMRFLQEEMKRRIWVVEMIDA